MIVRREQTAEQARAKAADPTNAAATPPDLPKPAAPAKPVIKRVRKTAAKRPTAPTEPNNAATSPTQVSQGTERPQPRPRDAWRHVSFGEFGLKATERGRLTARQIEAARRAMTRHIKRGGRVWIRIFPDKPISQKPAEVRMGNGKGNPEY